MKTHGGIALSCAPRVPVLLVLWSMPTSLTQSVQHCIEDRNFGKRAQRHRTRRVSRIWFPPAERQVAFVLLCTHVDKRVLADLIDMRTSSLICNRWKERSQMLETGSKRLDELLTGHSLCFLLDGSSRELDGSSH